MFDRMKEDIQSVFHRDPAARNTFEILTNYPGMNGNVVGLSEFSGPFYDIPDPVSLPDEEFEEIAEEARFTEVCYLLIYGELPDFDQLEQFKQILTMHSLLHEDMKKFFEGYPSCVMCAARSPRKSAYPKSSGGSSVG